MFEKQINRSLRRHVMAGVATVAFLSIGVGGWASTTDIAGAVIAAGQLVVETSVKKVQHPTGGVVGELFVREGDHVKAGDVVVRLDETQTRAELDVILKGLDESAARRGRMEAELSDLIARTKVPEVAHLIKTETQLFLVRKAARDGQKATLREQVKGLREQIAGKDKELDWIRQELAGVNELWKKNLVQFTKVVQLERDAAKIEGERGALVAAIAQSELKILQVDENMRQDVGRDMADIRAKTSELAEKRVAAEDKLSRIDIRAPQNGVVNQLNVHTVGGVIAPPSATAEPIMLIVPEADNLIVEAKVRPQDVDQLHAGRSATLRFSAFNQRTTPELNGVLSMVSADVVVDQRKPDQPYYVIRIKVSDDEIARLGVKLVPGMPVEAYVKTDERTVMSYLIKPVHDQIMRAFREK
jgi:HlyD family secretion protein